MTVKELEEKLKLIETMLDKNTFKNDYLSYLEYVGDTYIEIKWTQRKPTEIGYFRLIDVLTMNNVFITKTNYANYSVIGRIYVKGDKKNGNNQQIL